MNHNKSTPTQLAKPGLKFLVNSNRDQCRPFFFRGTLSKFTESHGRPPSKASDGKDSEALNEATCILITRILAFVNGT